MSTIDRALFVATSAHDGQVDKLGRPYICHVMSVWARVRNAGLDETHQIVALLHDVVEDSSYTIDDISNRFSGEVTLAVDAITKRNGETHDAYLDRVCANPIAKAVKFHDSSDNHFRIGRIEDEATRERLKAKYKKVFARLSL